MEKRNPPPYLYREIIGFFLPLLLNQGVVTLTAPFLNFGVSRALNPGTALAAFGASFSMTIIFNSVVMTSLKLYNSLLKDRESFCTILRFNLWLAAAAGGIFAALAATRAGDLVFSSLFNLSPEAVAYSKDWMVWMIPVPALIALRSALQGICTVYRHTFYTALGTGFRMFVAFGIVTAVIFFFPARPGMASGAAFFFAIATEVILLHLFTRRWQGLTAPTAVPDYNFSLTPGYLFRYSLPLWISSLAWTGSFPMINCFIAQTLNPEAGLAGFSILRSLNVCLNSPLLAVATTVLIMGNSQSMRKLMVLGMLLVTGMTLANGLLCLDPVGRAVLSGIFNLEGNTLAATEQALFFFLVTPLLFYIRFFTEGLFMREKRPAAIGITGLIRLALLFVTGWITTRLMPSVNGVILGMALMTVAAVSDAGFTALAFYVGHRRETAD